MSRRVSVSAGDTLGGRFQLGVEVGEGGMGRVYEAVDMRYDRAAAVKVIGRGLADDEEFRQRFEREADAAQRVTHPHVLPVWDHGEHEGLLYLATPLCDTDLGTLLNDHGQLEPARALAIITQIAWALDWAHGRGVVHRDVKPENILIVSGPAEDHAYLADFGLAKAAVFETLTQAGHPAGLTPAHAAPEQWLGEAVGPAADQYALAATLYTCLAGHPPFHPRRGPSLREAHLYEPPPDVALVVDAVPDGMATAIKRGLAKNPSQRWGTCRELVTAARAGSPSTPPAVATPPVPDQPAPRVDIPLSGEPSTVADSEPYVESGPEPWAELELPSEREPEPQPEPVPEPEPEPEPDREPEPEPLPEPPAEPPAASELPRGSRRAVGIGVAAALAVAAGVAGALLGGGSEEPGGRGGGSVRLTPVKVGDAPVDLAAGPRGSGGLWVANRDDTVNRIAPKRARLRDPDAIRAVESPVGLAVGDRFVWVVGVRGELAHIDAGTGTAAKQRANVSSSASGIAAGLGAAWITAGTANQVTRVDAAGNQRQFEVDTGPTGIAVGHGSVWVAHDDAATLVRLDATGRRTRTIALGGPAESVAVGDDSVWVATPRPGRLIRVNPTTNAIVRRIAVPASQSGADVAVGPAAVYYVEFGGNTVTQVDPRTNTIIRKGVALGVGASAAAVAEGDLWVTDADGGRVAKVTF